MGLKNKKGAALLQVLLVTVVLAGMATMLLRASLSRSTSARQTRRTVSAQLLVHSCMVEVNALWAAKKPEVFQRDMSQCLMYCKTAGSGTCANAQQVRSYTCQKQTISGVEYTVTANFEDDVPEANGWEQCKLTYEISSEKDVL